MLIDCLVVIYFIVGACIAMYQSGDDHGVGDFNLADFLFGCLAVATFWPLIFLSMAIEGFKE